MMRPYPILVAVIAGLMAGCVSAVTHHSPSARPGHLLEKMKSLTIEAVDFDQAPARQVADFYAAQSTLLDASHEGIAFAFPHEDDQEGCVSLHLRHVSLLDAVEALCKAAGIHFAIKDDAVSFESCHWEYGPLTIRSFVIPASILMQYLEQQGELNPTPEALKKLFERYGARFPQIPGSRIGYSTSNQLVTVANEPRSLELIRLIVDEMNKTALPKE